MCLRCVSCSTDLVITNGKRESRTPIYRCVTAFTRDSFTQIGDEFFGFVNILRSIRFDFVQPLLESFALHAADYYSRIDH
jgi:hypothetical protein